eukprot:15348183-Ditylum_brightwellii.AAC.1
MGHTSFKYDKSCSFTPTASSDKDSSESTGKQHACSKPTIDNVFDICLIAIILDPCLIVLWNASPKQKYFLESSGLSSSLYPAPILQPFKYKQELEILQKLRQNKSQQSSLREVHSLFRLRGLDVIVLFSLVEEKGDCDEVNSVNGNPVNINNIDPPPELIDTFEESQDSVDNELGPCLCFSMKLMEVRNGRCITDDGRNDAIEKGSK